MPEKKLEQVVKFGLYGTPEIKPEERNLFLSTLRERIYIALTKEQVRQRGMYDEVLRSMKEVDQAELLINGDVPYQVMSNYIKEATQQDIPYTIVQNQQHDTPVGLILAAQKEAVEKEDIFVRDDVFREEMNK